MTALKELVLDDTALVLCSGKTRAELVDESLEILTGLWKGQPFSYTGKHYTVKECKFYPPPPPVQQPRIPIWAVGAYPRPEIRRPAAAAIR